MARETNCKARKGGAETRGGGGGGAGYVASRLFFSRTMITDPLVDSVYAFEVPQSRSVQRSERPGTVPWAKFLQVHGKPLF